MKLLFFVFFILIQFRLLSQHISTFATNTNSGIYAVMVNPAQATYGTDWLSINLFGAAVGVENNFIRTNLSYSPLQMATLKHVRDKEPHIKPPYFKHTSRTVKKTNFYSDNQLILPSFKINIIPKLSLFLFAKERAIGNVGEFGRDIFPLLSSEKLSNTYVPSSLNTDIRVLAYNEIAAGIAFVAYDKRETVVKFGATLKRLTPRFSYLLNTEFFTTEVKGATATVNSRYRLLNTDLREVSSSPMPFILGQSSPGNGFAVDVGLMYEHRPRRLKHKYRQINPKGKNKNFRQRNILKYDYRVGVSIIDWGYIDFINRIVSDNIIEINSTIDLANFPESDNYFDEIRKNERVVTTNKEIKVFMPTTAQLLFDYRVNNKWFLNIIHAQNLRSSNKAENLYTPTSTQIIMRRENRGFAFAVPLRLVPRTRTATIGWMINAGPFFIGSNNFFALFKKKIYNWSVYTGVNITLKYKRDPTIEDCRKLRI